MISITMDEQTVNPAAPMPASEETAMPAEEAGTESEMPSAPAEETPNA